MRSNFWLIATHKILFFSRVNCYGKQGDATVPDNLRPFSSVNFPMPDEGSPLPEGLPTFTALIRPFSNVNFIVFNENGLWLK